MLRDLRPGQVSAPRPVSRSCLHAPGSQHRVFHSRHLTLKTRTHAASDPYKVLGVSSSSDSDAVNRAYKNKLKSAEGDAAQKRAIEEAHTSILMSGLSSRLKGGTDVAKDVRFADRAQYFPWRPKPQQASQRVMLFSAVAQAAFLAWGLLSPLTAGQQPIAYSAAAGAAGNMIKLNAIFPPKASDPENPERVGQGMKNILRAGLLALIATFLGCAVLYTIPDTFVTLLNRRMPYWFYDSQNSILCVGTAVANWLTTAFYR